MAKLETYQLDSGGGIPNHPDWPLVVYLGAWDAVAEGIDPSRIEDTYRGNGWGGTWRNGIYGFHHYHSRAHEVLGVARGSAHVQFGGPDGPALDLSAGDAAVLPAGTGHKKETASPDLLVVGAYPHGQSDWDLLNAGDLDREDALGRIQQVPAPDADPVLGEEGSLLEYWT